MANELERCKKLVIANLTRMIESTRRDIENWWEKCYYSEEQRRAFAPYFFGTLLSLFIRFA